VQLSVNRFARWHFMNLSYRHEFKNKIELQFGLGYNITQVFNEYYYTSDLFIHPYSEKLLNRFSLDYGIKKYFYLDGLTTKLFINYTNSLLYTDFIYKTYYVVDSETFTSIKIHNKSFLYNQSLNFGLQTKLKTKLDFTTSIGINHIVNELISNNPIKLRFEMGFVYEIKKQEK
jgi:hypothetical protein